MTIRARLALGLVAIAIIFAAPLTFALHSLRHLHRTTLELRQRDFAASLLLNRMRGALDGARQGELALLFVPADSTHDGMMQRLVRVTAMSDTLALFGLTREATQIRAAVADAGLGVPSEFHFAVASDTARADSISRTVVGPALRGAERVIATAEQALRERTSERVRIADEETIRGRNAALAALLLATALALVVGVLLWRAISQPVSALEEGMAAVADGNFHHALRISPDRRDEFGRLAGSFQSMTQQLAALDKLQAEFISVASHELKTPINVVLGYLQLLDEHIYGPLTREQHEIVRTITSQSQSLARLVHQLLDVSRFEAGGGRIDPRPIDLNKFLDELEQTFRVLALQRGVDFRIDRRGTLPSQVQWDADRVNEVLGNLLSNAFKFTGRGGCVSLAIESSEDEACIVVRDTGAGIPGTQLPHVFEKFYQADNQSAAAHRGTGLGLAIAKQIVDAHRGTISVESTVGRGTTFKLTLPLRVKRTSLGARRPTAAAATQ
ncbi:MAG: HAMP domain-containing histidine kinase [Gemmatimonadota bacterium]|nr:HAMP domain-containing histidine kinase [Gemmatimonadota bacterium]